MENSFELNIQVTMDGLRKSMSNQVYDLKKSFTELLSSEDIAQEDAEDVIDDLNSLICSINAIQCVSVEGIEGFSNQPDVHVKLIELDDD